MPSTLIEVRRHYTSTEVSALIEAVQAALVEAFKIPAADRTLRLIGHEPHGFVCSPRVAEPDRYTLVTIDCFAGRSLDAKRALYRTVVRNLAPLGIPSGSIKILLRESPMENWGIGGGQAACDVELGFKVDV